MTKAKRVQIDLPEPLYQALVAYQKQQSIPSPSLAAQRVLEEFLPVDAEASTLADASQKRLTVLEEKVARLFELVAQTRKDTTTPTSVGSPKADTLDPPTVTAASPLYLEEIDDEPDEILFDFLEPET